MIDADRQLLAVGSPGALVEHRDRQVRGGLEVAELAADVAGAVPGVVPRLEREVAVQVVPDVGLVDVGVGIRRRAGVDLIEVAPV